MAWALVGGQGGGVQEWVVGFDPVHQGTFGGDRNVLTLDCGGGCLHINFLNIICIVYSEWLNFLVCMPYLFRAAI